MGAYTEREAWLSNALSIWECDVLLGSTGQVFPHPVRVSCGWARGCRGAKSRQGETYPPEASADGHVEMFITPELEDAHEVLLLVWKQALHAARGGNPAHDRGFADLARACGYDATLPLSETAPTADDARLLDMLAKLGPYPHSACDPAKGRKQDTNRQLLVTCSSCLFKFRTSARQLRRIAWSDAKCPCCGIAGCLYQEGNPVPPPF